MSGPEELAFTGDEGYRTLTGSNEGFALASKEHPSEFCPIPSPGTGMSL